MRRGRWRLRCFWTEGVGWLDQGSWFCLVVIHWVNSTLTSAMLSARFISLPFFLYKILVIAFQQFIISIYYILDSLISSTPART